MKTSWLILALMCAVPLLAQTKAAHNLAPAHELGPAYGERHAVGKAEKHEGHGKHTSQVGGSKPAQTHSVKQKNRRRANGNVSLSHITSASGTPPKQFPKGQTDSTANRGVDSQRPANSAHKRTVVQPITSKPTNSAQTVRPALLPSSSSSLANARRRGPNPAAISGLGVARSTNTGAINGSRMRRKP